MLRRKSAIILFGFVMVFMALSSAYGRDDISVSCYLGDPSEDRLIGGIAVFNVSSARGNCNALYYDCEGNCTPCYTDEDSRVICIDSSGRPYYR